MWTLTNVDIDFEITRGTLAANHDGSEVIECLEDGEYLFETTANAAFAEEIRWNICDKDGVAGALIVARGVPFPGVVFFSERAGSEAFSRAVCLCSPTFYLKNIDSLFYGLSVSFGRGAFSRGYTSGIR